jgi:steroid 5-alpha reductase family enzyme
MSEAEKRAVIAWPIVILCAGFLAWAGSDGGQFPTFALVVALIFGGQWLAFVPAYLSQSEKFFDLTGSITYILAILFVLWAHPAPTGRVWLVALLVVVWAVRLGSFLFWRIQKAGKDGRFDPIKPSFIRFLTVWTIQGLWVSFTAAAALAALTNHAVHSLNWTAWLGLAVWLVGFALEVTADAQKSSFNAQPANKGQFIRTGLWAYSRHPN